MFNAEKYAALLEGLEVTVKQFSELSNSDDDTLRFDAEHYQHHYLAMVNQLKLHQHSKLLDLIKKSVITGHTPSMKIDRFYDGNIAFIKTDNLRENQIVDSFTDYLTEAGNAELKSSKLKLNNILVTIIGATPAIVGRCAIVREEHLPANINQNIALIEADDTKINPNYLNIYLNSKFGRGMLHFHSRQTEQVNLNCREVERVLVPLFPKLEVVISDLSNQSSKLKAASKELYAEAEQELLEAVGLADFKPSTQNTNIKTFAQSFGVSGRLDAEYYQPKYEEVMAQITSQTHAKLLDVVTIKKSIEPGSDAYADEGLPFIRVSDFSKTGLTTPDKCLSDEYYEANQKKLNSLKPKQNTILFSKDGSVGTAYLLREDLHGVTSGAILHLSLKRDDVLPEYLTLVLNSKLVQMQAERDAGGSIILHWRVGEIENVVLPIIALATQTKISELVQQSFSLKAQSEHLLSVAKRAVEIAIEQDEAAAMHFIVNSQ